MLQSALRVVLYSLNGLNKFTSPDVESSQHCKIYCVGPQEVNRRCGEGYTDTKELLTGMHKISINYMINVMSTQKPYSTSNGWCVFVLVCRAKRPTTVNLSCCFYV